MEQNRSIDAELTPATPTAGGASLLVVLLTLLVRQGLLQPGKGTGGG